MTKLLLAAALLARAAPPAAASTCGVKGTDTTEWGAGSGQRIVNGQEATSCEWKWQACLKTPGQRQCWCGGTLISETWVLTAAHCVHSEGTTSAADSFSIMLGDFNHYQSGEMGSGEQEISVKNVIPHENYNEQTMDYDYALVELATPADMTSCVGTACLPTEDDALTGGEECYISGWGTLSEGGSQPDNIQEAKVSIVDSSDCDTRYGGGIDETTMLCAQGTDDKGNIVDACQGDSGGPLVCEKGGTWYVHGATSWGYGCAAAQYPGIWARVTSELDWINGHVNAPPTPATPSPPITPAPTLNFDGSLFMVIDGECTVDESSCALSPNYPSNYGPDQTCSIAVDQDRAEPIHVMVFDTEADWDMLTVNGQVYSGSTGPGGVLPTATITWSSDFMIEQGGWRLCPLYQQFPTTAPTPAPPTHAPTPVPPTPPPTHFQCGVKGEDNTPWIGARIVNGQEASACEWTWQVGLKSAGGFGESFCGGTLIDKRWVLTAAHCVGEASFTIMAGVFDRTPGNDEPVILQVANAFRHPDYDPSTFNMDFALVQLAEDAPLGDCIGTACLPDADLPAGSTCYISGWGTMTLGGHLSSTLQEAEMTMLSNEDCSMKYKGIWNATWPNVTEYDGPNMNGPNMSTTVPASITPALSTTMDNNDDNMPAMSTTMDSDDWSWDPITDNMTCAEGVLNGNSTGACQGDAGGPLVCNNSETGYYELHGVTSWSYGCADTDYPGVWARVTSARDWIQRSMDNPPDPPTPHPPMSDGETWTVASGDCVISGDCLESPNYPEEYGNEQACTILVSPSNTMAIEVSAFQTEENFDHVSVDGNWFSGGEGQGPDGVVPTSMITWSSDYTVTAGGWKLCLVEGPGESACQDELVNNGAGGLMPWHDADGDQYTCSWYDGTNSCDEPWVDSYPNFGMSANQACCACGGGGYDGGYYYDDGGNESGLGSEGWDDVTTSTDFGLGTDEDLFVDMLSFASRPVAFSCYLLACALAVAWAA